MASFNHDSPPLEDYVTKLLLLETIKCARDRDEHGLDYLQNVMYELALRWSTIKRPRN